MPDGKVAELKPRPDEITLIDQIHEDRIQKLEDGLKGCEVGMAKLDARLDSVETTISTGLKSVTDSIAPISARFLADDKEKTAREAQEQLIKKYKAPLIAAGAAIITALIEGGVMWLFHG